MLADVGIVRNGDGQFERDGLLVDAPKSAPRSMVALANLQRLWISLSFRHA